MVVVYLALGVQQYVDELFLSALALRRIGGYDGRICVVADRKLEASAEIKAAVGGNDLELEPHYVGGGSTITGAAAAAYKLALPDLIQPGDGERVFYLDTDVVACRRVDIDHMAGAPPPGKIAFYGYPPGVFRKQRNEFMAGFLTRDPRITEHRGFCAGIMAYRNDDSIRSFFRRTHEDYSQLIRDGRVNACWDQPVLCRNAISEGRVDLSLTGLVLDKFMPEPECYDEIRFYHFCGRRDSRLPLLRALATSQYTVQQLHEAKRQLSE